MQSQNEGVAPLAALRRRWPLAVAAVVVGAGLGFGVAAAQATVHTAETRLAVGGSDISAYTIPGFAYTSKEVASNYARFITPEGAVAGLAREEAAKVASVTASPIPESNLITVEIEATDPAVATSVADRAADKLVAEVERATSRVSPAGTLRAYSKASTAAAQAQSEYDGINQKLTALRAAAGASAPVSAAERRLRRDLSAASAKVATLQVKQEALKIQYQSELQSTMPQNRLVKVRPAVVARDDATSRRERYAMAGGGAGFLLALVLAARRERRNGAVLASPDPRGADGVERAPSPPPALLNLPSPVGATVDLGRVPEGGRLQRSESP